jgi:hypothetical protein
VAALQQIPIAPLQQRNADPEVVVAPLRGSRWLTPNGPSNDAVHRKNALAKGSSGLGSSGNSIQRHLHFRVMDGPEPLDPRSVPFYIASWLRVAHKIVCGPRRDAIPQMGLLI